MDKGAVCSKHKHKVKCETFTIESGKVKMEYGDLVKDMFPGDSVTIFPGTFHRFSGYEKSVISEVSTIHSDDDVVREEDSYLAPLLIFFDIDGTLIASDGIISKEHIGKREFGIISSRSRKRSQDICDKMNISPSVIICCRVVSRASEMKYADRLFPCRRTCFPAGTKIIAKNKRYTGEHTGIKNGINESTSVSIESLKVGDEVLSYNEINGSKEFKKIENVFCGESDNFVEVYFSNDNKIRCTSDHKIAVNTDGRINWIEASKLTEGQQCIQKRYSGLALRLSGIRTTGLTYYDIFDKDFADDFRRRLSQIKTENPSGTQWTEEQKKHKSEINKKIFSDPKHEVHSKSSREKKKKNLLERWNHQDTRDVMMEGIRKGVVTRKQDPDFVKKQLNNLGDFRFTGRINKTERRVSYLLRSMCPKEFKYNGNYRLGITLGNYIPDFVNVNGKKKVIEVYSKYWKGMNEGVEKWKKSRESVYGSLGWGVLFIEDIELKNKNKEILENKIVQFLFNPDVDIVTVTKIVRIDKKEKVYDIRVEDNHNYFAYGILVHNCYVGDMISDATEAAKSGWDFLSPQDYVQKVERGEI